MLFRDHVLDPGSQIVTLEKTTPNDTGVSFFIFHGVVCVENRYRFSEMTVSFRVEIGIVFHFSPRCFSRKSVSFLKLAKKHIVLNSPKNDTVPYRSVSFGIVFIGIVWYRFWTVSFGIVWYRFC